MKKMGGNELKSLLNYPGNATQKLFLFNDERTVLQ
jgi:hypothetical protein